MTFPRRRLDELVTRYRLEPTLREIFVEGETDFNLISWVIQSKNLESLKVAPISSLHVEVAEGGNRERLVEAAKFVGQELEKLDIAECAMFIVDADAYYIDGYPNNIPCLFLTDFACLEGYLCSHSNLQKVVKLCFYKEDSFESSEFEQLLACCKTLFLLRVAAHRLGRARIVYKDKDVLIDGNNVSVNFESIILKTSQQLGSSNTNGLRQYYYWLAQLADFSAVYAFNGHDFVRLLTILARRKGVRKELCNEKVVERALLTGIHVDDLCHYPLFKEILRRA